MAFFYARVYAFFCYYRKKERRKEIEEKILFFYNKGWDSTKVKAIVTGIFELRGSRKIARRLIPQMDIDFVNWFVEMRGLDHFEEALREGRGVVLMAGHLGNMHLSIHALRIMGYDVTFIKGGTPREAKHPRFEYYDHPNNTIFVQDPSLSKEEKEERIMNILRSGKVIYHPADAAEGRVKELGFLFGKEIWFPSAMVYFAHQAKAAIIPFIHLYQKGKITLIFKEPIDDRWRNGEGDYRRIVAEFAKLLESTILTYPEQYMGIYGPTVLAYYYRSKGKRGVLEEIRNSKLPFSNDAQDKQDLKKDRG